MEKENKPKKKQYRSLVVSIVMLVILASVASGAYILFLSNESNATASVEAPPLKMELYDEGWRECTGTPLDLGAMYGTDIAEIDFKVTKLAHSESENTETQIEGDFTAKLTCDINDDGNPDAIDKKELDKVEIDFENWDGTHAETITWEYGETNDFTITDNGKSLTVSIPTTLMYKQSGYRGTITITFDQYAYGEYSLSMQII